MSEEEKINVQTIQVDPKYLQRTIFRPSELSDKNGKVKAYFLRKAEAWVRHNSSPEMKRYIRIHRWAKRHMFQKGIKYIRRYLNKYIIKDIKQIPEV